MERRASARRTRSSSSISPAEATKMSRRWLRSVKRIKDLFRRLRAEKRCGLIAYVTCGDATVDHIFELERAGADAIELGVPFSDPIADGPVIQAAAQRALKKGTTMRDVFAMARTVRSRSKIPLIAFTYLN